MIYHNDCLELIDMWAIDGMELPFADLIVTDPPYMNKYKSNRRVKNPKFDYIQNDEDSLEFIQQYFQLCYDVLKDNSSIYIFSGRQNIDIFKIEFEKYFNLKNILIWVKNNHGSGDLRGSYAPKYEMILYGHKGRDTLRNKRHPDVLQFNKVSSLSLTHPTEKPIELLKFLISNSSDESDLVFDGCMGTGSTLLAAKELNRKYIGIEIEREYYEVAKERLCGN